MHSFLAIYKKKDKQTTDIYVKAETCFSSYDFANAAAKYSLYLIDKKNISDSILFKTHYRLYTCFNRIGKKDAAAIEVAILDSLFKLPRFKQYYSNYHIVQLKESILKGNYRGALLNFAKAQPFQLTDNQSVVNAFYWAGNSFIELNIVDSAQICYKNGSMHFNGNKDANLFERANCFNGLAYIELEYKSNLYSAKLYYDSMMFVMQNVAKIDSDFYAWNIFSLGAFYQNKGLCSDAFNYYKKAYEVYSEMQGFESEKTNLLSSLSGIDSYFNRHEEAREKINKALMMAESRKDTFMLKTSLYYKAFGYYKERKLKDAIRVFKQSIALKVKDLDYFDASSYQQIGVCYLHLNQKDSVYSIFKYCIKNYKNRISNDIKYKTEVCGLLARYYIEIQKFKRVIELTDNTIDEIEKQLGRKSLLYGYMNAWKARALMELGKYNASLVEYNSNIRSSLYNEVNCSLFEVPDFQYQDVISFDHLSEALMGKAKTLQLLAEKTSDNKNKEFFYLRSLAHYEKAVEVLENHKKNMGSETDQLQFSDSKISANELELGISMQLFRLTNDHKYLKQAFAISDRSKANVVVGALKDNEYKHFAAIPDSLLQQEKKLKEEIFLLRQTIHDARKSNTVSANEMEIWQSTLVSAEMKAEVLARYLEKNYPKYYQKKYASNSLNYEKLHSYLSDNEAIVEYAFCSDSLYIFLVNKKSAQVFAQSSKGLEDKVLAFRNRIGRIDSTSYTQQGMIEYVRSSSGLYNCLIKPIENQIKGKQLIIVPDGVLTLIPFEALVVNDSIPARCDYALPDYFVKHNTLSYAYASSLYLMQQTVKSPQCKGVLAFAPEYGKGKPSKLRSAVTYKDLKPIPGTQKEAENVVSAFGGSYYIGSQADEETFREKSGEGKILHLAMHTIIDNQEPLYSKLAFTQGVDSINDGFLNAFEIYGLKLRSPLVVLSACNSGYGKLMKGEGLVSLSRAFLFAGCPSMVFTLWSIADNSTVSIMNDFYINLNSKEQVNSALQKAQIKYINESDSRMSHPYYWSAFLHSGSSKPLNSSANLDLWYIFIAVFVFTFVVFVEVRK